MKNAVKNRLVFYWGIAAISLIVMIFYGNLHGFWYDEFAQICYSAPPNTLLESLLIADPTPPLFTVVANLWMRVVPHGERWLLLLPQLSVACSVIVMGLWCEKFYGFWCGILGSTIVAFSQIIIEQCGFEFRGYGFYLLFATLTFYLHSRLDEKKFSLGFTLSLIGLAYCHLFGACICLVLGIWDFLLICRKRLTFKSFIPYLLAAVAFLPWCLYFLLNPAQSAATASADWMTNPSLWETVKLIAFLCGNNIIICLLFAIGGILAVRMMKVEWKTLNTMEQAMPLFIGIALIAVVFTYGLLRANYASLWVKRYFTGLFPCAVFLAVWGANWLMERYKKKWHYILILLILTTVPVWGFQIASGDTPFGVYFHREVAQVLQAEPGIDDAGTLVLSTLGQYTDGWDWLYLQNCGTMSSIQLKSTDDIETDQLKAYETIYIDSGYNTVGEKLQKYLDTNYRLAHNWADISLRKFVKK